MSVKCSCSQPRGEGPGDKFPKVKVTAVRKPQLAQSQHVVSGSIKATAYTVLRQAYLRQLTSVVLNKASHAIEMPSSMGLAKSPLKLISPLAEDLYTPFLAGLTVACIAIAKAIGDKQHKMYTLRSCSVWAHQAMLARWLARCALRVSCC